MESSLKMTLSPATCAASPLMPITSVRFWGAIAGRSATWSIGRDLIYCCPPNSDVCTRSPSMTVRASPTRSIFPWGYYSEHASPPSSPDVRLHPVAALSLCNSLGTRRESGRRSGYRSQGHRSQGKSAAHQKRTSRQRFFESCGLAHTAGDDSCAAASATADLANPATGAEGQEFPSFPARHPGGRAGGVSQSGSFLSQRVFVVRWQAFRSRTLRERHHSVC